MTKFIQRFLIVSLVFMTAVPTFAAYFNLPPLPPAGKYGDIVMDRAAMAHGEKAVVFSHWSHRSRFSCRVCHFELDFDFVAGETDITAEDLQNGEFCGACHDGERAFGITKKNCSKCHTGPAVDRNKQFMALADKLSKLPYREYGNGINWVMAQKQGLIKPKYSIFHPGEKPLPFSRDLVLNAEWNWVPPAVFSHSTHTAWLDCANCHPQIFNVKKKTTKHFRMEYILDKKFCGICHFSVALPIDDCVTCHPDMGNH